jgi:acetyltransferase-like isoleucine patch superfamily enzyme
MFNFFLRKFCLLVYNIGLKEANYAALNSLYERVVSEDRSCFDIGSKVINLANDKSRIKIGSKCHIWGTLTIFPKNGYIEFGSHCSLGSGSNIVSSSKVKIGCRVMIAHNVSIYDNNSHPIDANIRHQDFIENFSIGMQEHDLRAKHVLIEDDVWIGFNSIILKGVRIGQGAIIGAGSIVTKDVDPWTINVGNPLRVVKRNIKPEN